MTASIRSTAIAPGSAGVRDPVVAWLLACCGALLVVRAQLASVPALWIDEAFSLYHARLPLAHLWTEGWRLESSPPLYYSTLWAWQRVFGDGEQAARLLSVALTAVSTVFVHRAARILAGPRAGAAAALVVLLPTLGLEYAVEIRPYALQLVWISIALAALAGLVADRRSGAAGGARTAARIATIVLVAAAAFYTHSTSFAFHAGLAAAGLHAVVASRAGGRGLLVWALACAALAVLCVPQLLSMAGVLATNSAGLAWIPSSLDPVTLSRVARQLVLGQMHWGYRVSGPIAALLYAVIVASAWRSRGHPGIVSVGVVLPAVGALALVAADVVQPVLLHRTALWLLLPASILVGCAAARADWRSVPLRVVSIALLVAIAASSGAYLESRPSQRPWSDVLRELGARLEPGDRIVFLDPEVACVHHHYATGALRDAPGLWLNAGPQRRFRNPQRLDLGCNRPTPIGPADLGTGAGRDWVLTGDDGQRADLDDVLRASDGRLQAVPGSRIERGGRTHATQVARH